MMTDVFQLGFLPVSLLNVHAELPKTCVVIGVLADWKRDIKPDCLCKVEYKKTT